MTLREYAESFLKNKKYMFCLILTMVFAYGYYFTYESIHIDDTAMGRYYTEGRVLRQGRWGIYVLTNLFRMTEYRPFIHKCCTVGSLFLACILLCSILKRESENRIKEQVLTVFACLFVTYSMINEILFFVGSQWSSTVDYVFTALAVWLLFKKEKNRWDYLWAAMSLAFAISLYEVSASVYIVLVMAVMLVKEYCRENKDRSVKDSIWQGIPMLIVLICAIILQTATAYLFLAVTGWSPALRIGGSFWLSGGFTATAKSLISNMAVSYGINGLFYFPMAEVTAAGICNLVFLICCLWNRKWNRAFLWFLFGIGGISMSLMQGDVAFQRAAQQAFSIYTAFIFTGIFLKITEKKRERWIKRAAYIGAAYLVICQAVDLNKWEYVNYLRDKEEKKTAMAIGNVLEREYDLTKPVVFVGKYRLSDNVRQYTHVKSGSSKDILVRKVMACFPFPASYPYSHMDDYGYQYNEDHNSILSWGVFAFGENNTEIVKYFRMLGYELQQGTMEMYQEGKEISLEMPSYPEAGYIRDCGDYILVNFGI